MKDLILSCFELKKEDLKDLTYIQYQGKNIYLGKEQKWEISPSGKTIYVVQYDKGEEIGRKGFRISSCIFVSELID